jgi:putative tricarboxylic transport membrane protein
VDELRSAVDRDRRPGSPRARVVQGFEVALSPTNLLPVLIGVTIGMVIGVLPGRAGADDRADVAPHGRPAAETAVIMLAGVHYGSMYGGHCVNSVTEEVTQVPGVTDVDVELATAG